ncbi:TPA: hypothetical protein ACVU5S_004606 [Vibrio parahaemolyticus]|nr:hypothetical protein [Vibrio parahaemolyticus]HBH7876297.1 hypothetical protein [Vibrio parahaemolyticus]HCG8518875.1 hypothetical protein [Vibrio parahaemolyticus]
MQSFSDWVCSVGGTERAAHLLNRPEKTIDSWVTLYRHPSIENIQHIEDTIGVDVIDFSAWRAAYLRHKGDYPAL